MAIFYRRNVVLLAAGIGKNVFSLTGIYSSKKYICYPLFQYIADCLEQVNKGK
jgi:hypothetical protein